MKKVSLIAAVGLLFVGMNSASAMTEEELKTKLTQAYKINGATYQIPADAAKQIDDYLREFIVDPEQAQYIAEEVDNLIATIEEGDAKSFKDFTATEKDAIRAAVENVSTNTDVKASITTDGNLVVLNPDTLEPFTVIDGQKVKQTGAGNLVLCAGVVSLLGIGLALNKLRKNA